LQGGVNDLLLEADLIMKAKLGEIDKFPTGCCLIQMTRHSPWAKLFCSGDDEALITVTGFDHTTFKHLLELFTPMFLIYTPWIGSNDGRTYKRVRTKRGRKRMVTPTSCLAVVLAWFQFKGVQWILQGWFGFTARQTNVWLQFGRRILLRVLRNHPETVVKFPEDACI
jgi:hypothetical protein